MLAREWLHANHKRLVTVKFGPEAGIHTVDRKGQKLRTFNLKGVDGINVEKTSVALKTIKTLIFDFLIHSYVPFFSRNQIHVNIRTYCCVKTMTMIWCWSLNPYHHKKNS